jgi:hypothetical protein
MLIFPTCQDVASVPYRGASWHYDVTAGIRTERTVQQNWLQMQGQVSVKCTQPGVKGQDVVNTHR